MFIRGFMNGGLNEAAAEAAALTAAKLFRAKLVAKGCIKKRVIDESLTSDVPGVHFSEKSQKWAVQICCDGGLLWGGLCKEKAEAEARCTQLRKALGLPQRVKRTASMAEHATPQFEPRKPFRRPGVTWDRRCQSWRAGCVRHEREHARFKPLDSEELEKAFSRAVAWLKKLRREIEKGMKCKKGKIKKGKMQVDKKGENGRQRKS